MTVYMLPPRSRRYHRHMDLLLHRNFDHLVDVPRESIVSGTALGSSLLDPHVQIPGNP